MINYYVQQVVAGGESSQIRSWPLQAMNALPDQHLLTRILTAGRGAADPWTRTCFVVRPFHAVTDFSDRYTRAQRPAEELVRRAEEARARVEQGASTSQDEFWAGSFDPHRDSFIKMLEGAWYGMFFVGTIPRLDHGHCLPRIDMLVPFPTSEDDRPWSTIAPYARMVLTAFRQVGFEVAADHDMFDAKGQLDIMPRLLIDVHNTVKQWSALLYARAQEHIAFQISGFLKGRRKEARIRPWKRHELEAWMQQMTREREGRLASGVEPRLGDGSGNRLKGAKDVA